MKTLCLPAAVVLMVILVGAVPACTEDAQPGLIFYKGLMADYQGKLIHDTLSVTFSIYDAPAGGNLLWTENHPSMIIWGGVYTVLLGAVEPFHVGLFWESKGGTVVRSGSDRWLGVTIEGLTELISRKRIATVAYAVNAEVVDGRHAAEFVSSVHPDSMEGVASGGIDGCSDTVPMLTVINDCAGGGIKGECEDGRGVIGDGQTGLYGTTDDADGVAIHGLAENPATQAGYFKGNVTVNGETQIGLSSNDYHYLKIPGKDAWGYLFSSYPLDDTNAVDITYNYHVDPSGNEVFDNGTLNTSQFRMGHEGIEFRTRRNGKTPLTRMLIDPYGKTTFFAAVSAPRAIFDTLYVPDTCWAGQGFEVRDLGIGTTTPTDYHLHVKGSGNYSAGGLGSGSNHIARFENTSSTGDGMAIKLSSGTPGHGNEFVTFLDGSDGIMGKIEGQKTFSEVKDYDPAWADENFFFRYELAKLTINGVFTIIAWNVCFGAGIAVCPPPLSPIIGNGVMIGVFVAREVAYTEWRKSDMGVSYQSGNADYAEWLQQMDEGERLEPGDVVGVWSGKISKRTDGAQQLLVISGNPIFVGNMPPEDEEDLYAKVSFMGQVPVRVIGPVEKGDYIIPSGFEDGTGLAVSPELMTADEFSKVVGRAWSSSNNTDVKLINSAIGLGSGDVATLLGKQRMKNESLRERLARVKSQLDAYSGLKHKVSNLEGAFEKADQEKDQTLSHKDEK